MTWQPWASAWYDALYGPSGFYRRTEGPARHFATASQGLPGAGALLAEAVLRWMREERLGTFVDMGCGRGELLARVHAAAPDLRCVGVDVVPRPALPSAAEWVQAEGGGHVPDALDRLDGAFVLALEWLDVVPCPVAERDALGVLRLVEVEPRTGAERLGDPLEDADLGWCERHWPNGARVEVGRARDEAWRDLTDRLQSGMAVAADYGHLASARPPSGTLTGYRSGVQVPPIPDRSCDLTAHVAMDSLGADELTGQRSLLRRLGVSGGLPVQELARRDPSAYLQGLSRAAASAALTDPSGLGGFLWAVTRVRC